MDSAAALAEAFPWVAAAKTHRDTDPEKRVGWVERKAKPIVFGGDADFATPEMYEFLELNRRQINRICSRNLPHSP
jgi:hypothetical protein